MSIAYPIPRGTRQVTPDFTSDGTLMALPIPFYFIDPLDIFLGAGPVGGPFTPLVLNYDYAVVGAGVAGGGTATLLRAQTAGVTLRLMGLRVPNRTTNVTNDGAIIAAAVEQEFDAVELTMQEIRRDVSAAAPAASALQLTPAGTAWNGDNLPTTDFAAPSGADGTALATVAWTNGLVAEIAASGLGVAIGVPGGLASLDGTGGLNAAQMPNYAVSQISTAYPITATVRKDKDRWASRIAVAGADFALPASPTTTDCAPAINATMAALDSRGGGVVELPVPALLVNSPLDNHFNRVLVQGLGRGTPHDGGTNASFGTVVTASFATDAVLKHRTIYGINNTQNSGGGFVGLTTSGGMGGLQVISVRDAVYKIMIEDIAAGSSGAKFTCGVSRTDLAETANVFNCDIDLWFRMIDNATSLAADGAVFDGSSNANCCFNKIKLQGEWGNGALCRLINADNNDLEVYGTYAGTTGHLIYCHGGNAGGSVGGFSNRFKHVSGQAPIYAEGTDTAGVTSTGINFIDFLDTGNVTPQPTAGTASYWAWREGLFGSSAGAIPLKPILLDYYNPATIASLRAAQGSETVSIYNTAANHMLIKEPSGHVFSISLTNTGQLRIAPTANVNDILVLPNTTLGNVGFYGTAPVGTKPVVAGSKGGSAALASLMAALSALGLVTDTTS